MYIQIILLVLNLLNVVVHLIGMILLIHLYKKCRKKAQQLYLIHLSIAEFCMNLLEAVRITMNYCSEQYYGNQGDAEVISQIRHYLLIVQFTGVSITYYFDMIYITVDRLMVIYLSFRYRKYWNGKRAKYLLLVTWFIALTTSTIVALSYHYYKFQWEPVFFKYFFPTIEFLFILLAIPIYVLIFRRYTKKRKTLSKRRDEDNNSREHDLATRTESNGSHLINFRFFSLGSHAAQHASQNGSADFKRSVFYIPFLLITTFLVFMVIPDLCYLFIAIIYENPSETLSTLCWISYAVSNLIDAWIYIFLQHHVLNFLKKGFSRRKLKKEEKKKEQRKTVVDNEENNVVGVRTYTNTAC